MAQGPSAPIVTAITAALSGAAGLSALNGVNAVEQELGHEVSNQPGPSHGAVLATNTASTTSTAVSANAGIAQNMTDLIAALDARYAAHA
jgi:hypothetical protein